MHYLTYNPKFTAQEELLIDKALQEMPEKEIIKETVLEEVEFVYSIFITLKSDGGACLTLLVSSGVSLTSWGEGASLALVGHPSSDGVTIKMPYGVDVLHRPASHPIFSYWVG